MINNTTIVFDKNFKDFIKDLSKMVEKNWFNKYTTPDYDKMHKWIEDYVSKNSKTINYIGNITSMPNLYAINICLLLGNEIDKYTDFEQIDYSLFRKFDYANYSFGDDTHSLDVRCACKHVIRPKNSFYVYSKFNRINIQLGQDCIQKTGISNEFLNKLKIKTKKQYEKSKSYMKMVLQELTVYFEQMIINKKCIDCKTYNIPTCKNIRRCSFCYNEFVCKNSRNKNTTNFSLEKYIYLKIPYEKKDQIKNLGGKFDSSNKLWCIENRLFYKNKTNILSFLGKKYNWE